MDNQNTESDSPSFHPHEITWDEKKNCRIWDYYGSSTAQDTVYFGATVGAHVARIIRRLGLLKNKSIIIDFSCGKGHLIEHCSQHLPATAKIIGFDPSNNSVMEANARNRQTNNFGGAFHLPSLPSNIEAEYADLILLTEVIEHLDNTQINDVLSECYRILKPGGILFVTTPNNEQLDREKTICPECGCIFHRWQHIRSWAPITLKETLTNHGFDNVRTKTITWGNELIDIAFSLLRRKKTGIYAVARRPHTNNLD